MEGKLNGLTGQNGVEVCRRIDFQPCGTGNRVGLLSGSNNKWLANLLLILCIIRDCNKIMQTIFCQ